MPSHRMNQSARFFKARGFTLIELLVALVVIGAALAGVLLAFGAASRNSADPVVAQQLIGVAQSLTEEVMLQPYTITPNTTTSSGCARDGFNDVSDFNGYGTKGFVCTPDGTVISSLNGYSVSIVVNAATVAGVAMKQITVITSKAAQSYSLSTYRADLS